MRVDVADMQWNRVSQKVCHRAQRVIIAGIEQKVSESEESDVNVVDVLHVE